MLFYDSLMNRRFKMIIYIWCVRALGHKPKCQIIHKQTDKSDIKAKQLHGMKHLS